MKRSPRPPGERLDPEREPHHADRQADRDGDEVERARLRGPRTRDGRRGRGGGVRT